MVILYRRFGTTYRSHLQGSKSPRRKETAYYLAGFLFFFDFLTPEDGTDMLS
jgi:hypothetical protein